MVVEVDDTRSHSGRQAGWGDLIGGVVILLRRVETGETFVEEIPVELFQGGNFRQKLYLDKAVELVLRGLEALSVKPPETIHICTGYVLSRVRETLREEGYNTVPSKIVGETQRAAEQTFLKSLSAAGVGDITLDAGKCRFSFLLRWVHKDLKNRERFVKTGWPAWEKKLRKGDRSGANP